MAILIGLLGDSTQAANETNDAKQNTVTTQGSQNQTKKETTNAEKTNNNVAIEKSSNANLSDLGIRPHDFKGFKYGTTNYEISVPESTESVEVYAIPQDAKAKITGTGKKTLEKGENTVQVVVTAENGTKKTYTINIIREIQQEEYEEENTQNTSHEEETPKEEGKGLAELKINNLNLVPEFKTNVYEYTLKYIGENVKLNIETKPTDDDYVVEVIGNDNLQEGENTITILVSEKNGDNVATYQVIVNKSLVDEEAIAKEEAEKKAKQQKTIIGIVVAVVLLMIIIVVIIIRRRNRNIAEEYSGIGFYGNDEDEEEMPRALRENQYQEEKTEEIEQESEQEPEEQAQAEENFETMSKEELKEKFLNGYHSGMDIEFEDNNNTYHDKRRKAKHKGKRFK